LDGVLESLTLTLSQRERGLIKLPPIRGRISF
jgi:hypothetical protein